MANIIRSLKSVRSELSKGKQDWTRQYLLRANSGNPQPAAEKSGSLAAIEIRAKNGFVRTVLSWFARSREMGEMEHSVNITFNILTFHSIFTA